MRLTRRRFLFLGAATAGMLGAGYIRILEPGWLEVRELDIQLPRSHLKSSVRVLHLSDFHMTSERSLSLIENAIGRGLDYTPDLICLTGDFVTAGCGVDPRPYVHTLRLLSGAAPTFAVLGNHDGGIWSRGRGGFVTVSNVGNILRKSGIIVLADQNETISIRENRLALVGTTDLWSGSLDPEAAFRHLENGSAAATVVLSHNPDTKEVVGRFSWDLMLSGHTHGGQIVIPLVGPPIVPVHDRGYISGLNPWKDQLIYTTRGIGSLFGIRFNCRPEVSILNLT